MVSVGMIEMNEYDCLSMNHWSALYLAFTEQARYSNEVRNTPNMFYFQKSFFIHSSPSLDCPPREWLPLSPCCSDLSKSLPVQIKIFYILASHNLPVMRHNMHPVR